MFSRGIGVLFCGQCVKGTYYPEAGVSRLYHIVDITVACRFVWVGEFEAVFLLFHCDIGCLFGGISYLCYLFAFQYLYGALAGPSRQFLLKATHS